MQKKLDKIVKSLSLNNNIPVKDIEEAVKSQFLFVRRTIESATKDKEETFKIVLLPAFGKFLVRPNMINYIIRNKNKKNGDRSK